RGFQRDDRVGVAISRNAIHSDYFARQIKAGYLLVARIAQGKGFHRAGANRKECAERSISAVEVFAFLQRSAPLHNLIEPIDIVEMQADREADAVQSAITARHFLVV